MLPTLMCLFCGMPYSTFQEAYEHAPLCDNPADVHSETRNNVTRSFFVWCVYCGGVCPETSFRATANHLQANYNEKPQIQKNYVLFGMKLDNVPKVACPVEDDAQQSTKLKSSQTTATRGIKSEPKLKKTRRAEVKARAAARSSSSSLESRVGQKSGPSNVETSNDTDLDSDSTTEDELLESMAGTTAIGNKNQRKQGCPFCDKKHIWRKHLKRHIEVDHEVTNPKVPHLLF